MGKMKFCLTSSKNAKKYFMSEKIVTDMLSISLTIKIE